MGSCKVWDKPKETSVCWENPALILFSCSLMGKTENDLDPSVVFYADRGTYLKKINITWLGFFEKILPIFEK